MFCVGHIMWTTDDTRRIKDQREDRRISRPPWKWVHDIGKEIAQKQLHRQQARIRNECKCKRSCVWQSTAHC